MQADIKRSALSRIIACILAAIVLVGMMPEQVMTAIAESNNGDFKLTLSWNKIEDNCVDPDDPSKFIYDSDKEETRLVRLKVAYSNKQVSRAFEAGEITITVPGLKNAVRSGTSYIPDIAADRADIPAEEKQYDWSYTYTSTTDTYTFTYNKSIPPNSTFEGSFELVWKLPSRETIDGFEGELTAELFTSDVNVKSNTLIYTQTRKCDEYEVTEEPGPLFDETLPIDDRINYIWVKYDISGSDTYYARNINDEEVFELYFLEGAKAFCLDKYIYNTGRKETVDGKVYNIWSVTHDINPSSDSKYINNVFVAYPRDIFGKSPYYGNNNDNELLKSIVKIKGTYYDEKEEDYKNEVGTLAENYCEINLQDYDFSNVPGPIYEVKKHSYGIHMDSINAHDDYCKSNGAINSINLSDEKGSYFSALQLELFYTIDGVEILDDGSVLSKTYKPADSYRLEFVDDIIDVQKKDGSFRQLRDDEYEFTEVYIPSNKDIINANGHPIKADTYKVEIYVRTAERDGSGNLIHQCNNGVAAENSEPMNNGNFNSTAIWTGKITMDECTVKLPEDTVGVKVVVYDLAESWFTDEMNTIRCGYKFHTDDEDIMTNGGQIMNNMHFNLIGTKNETGEVFKNYDLFSYKNYAEAQSGTADNRQYLRDVEIYGHALDRDCAVTHIIEIPNEFKLDSMSIELDRSVSENDDGLDNEAYYFKGGMVSEFILGEGTELSDFSIYTIVPEGLKLTENANDAESLLNALSFYSSGGYSSAYIASHTNIDIKQYDGRQYIAFHFDFSDAPITTKTLSISGIPMYVFKHNLKNESVSYTMHSAMMVDQPGKWYSNGIDNNSIENGIWIDIDRDGDTSELASFASDNVELTNKESFHMELTKYVQTPLTNGMVNPKPEEVKDASGKATASAPKTYAGKEYSYFLYATVVSGVANQMVFADVIEPDGSSEWKGEFLGVDYSQIVEQLTYPDGAKKEPTIYYSSKEEVFTKTVDGKTLIDRDSFKSGGWTTQKPDKVRSIAVDFGDGQIESGMNMVLEIKMKAPDNVDDCYKLATNSCSIGYNWLDKTSGESDYPDYLSSNTVPVTYVPSGKITLTKKDEVTGINITNATFELYKVTDGDADTLIGEYDTNKNGTITVDALDYGEYYFVETKAPVGYEKSGEKFKVMVSQDDHIISVSFKNKRKVGQYTITKISDRTKAPIAGAEFQLYDSNGTRVDSNTYVTGSDGKLTVSGLAWGKYYLLESKAPKGYNISDEKIEFEINAQTAENPEEGEPIENEQKPAKATLVKCELTEGHEYDEVTASSTIGNVAIKGAVYRLYDSTGKQISTGVTDADGKIYAEDLTFGEYYFQEVSAAVGYETYPEIIKFTVGADQTENDLVIYTADSRKTGNVWLQKLDDAKESVKGAVYRLYNADGNLLSVSEVKSGQNDGKYAFVPGGSGSYDMITSNEGIIEIEGLQWGSYYIKETKAPKGYNLDTEAHEFTIDKNNVANTIMLHSTDARIKGKVEITKVDEEDESILLSGAVFTLYRNDNTVYRDDITTDDSGKVLIEDLEWGSYYLKEKKAPVNYSISSKNIKFSVNYLTAGKVQEITVTNPKETYKLTVNKKIYQKDIVLAHGNPTFTFKVTNSDTNETYHKTVAFGSNNITPGDDSYAEASAIFALPAGTYTVEEISTDRYILSEISINSGSGTLINDETAAQVILGAEDGGGSPEITVTFKNDKTDQSDTSHNSSIANMFSKSRKLTAIVADYQGPEILTDENIPTDKLKVYAVYDDGTQETVNNYTLNPEKLSYENNGTFDIEVLYEEGGVSRKDSFNVNVHMPSPFKAQFVKPNGDGTYSYADKPTEVTIDGTTYRGLVTITDYSGTSSVVNFPATLSGYIDRNGEKPEYAGETFKVVQVGGNSLVTGMNDKTAITFAEGIEVINNRAFVNYANLDCTVKFPSTLKRIGDQAFNSCGKMHGALVIPDSVEYIGEKAFYGCGFTGSLTIPNSVQSIGEWAFKNCQFTGNLTIPNSVKSIGNEAFRGCKFDGSLTFEDGCQLKEIKDHTFWNVPFSGDLNIPDGVTSIGKEAFQSANGIKSFVGGTLTLPDTLTSVGTQAFYACEFTGGLTIPSQVTTIGEWAFRECKFDGNLTFEDDCQLTEIKNHTFWNVPFSGDLNIPNCVTSIGEEAFQSANGIISFNGGKLTLPDTLTSIGAKAFYECEFESELKLPSNLTAISNQAFYKCRITGELVIPRNVTSIGDEAFFLDTWSAGTIESITFESGSQLRSIGRQAFHDQAKITTLELPKGLETIGDEAFVRCRGLQTLTLPDTLKTIGSYAFSACENLSCDLTIPASVEVIKDHAFNVCRKFKGHVLTIPKNNSLKSIGSNAFYHCYFDSESLGNMKSQIWIPIDMNNAGDQAKGVSVDTSYYYGNGDKDVNSGIISTSQMEAGSDIFYGYQVKYGFFQRDEQSGS